MVIPRITQRSESKIIGLEVHVSSPLDNEALSALVSDLWKRFQVEKAKIPNKKNEKAALGVYTSYQENGGKFSLIAASEVTTLESVPAGMVPKVIPTAKYLIFGARGSMLNAATNAWEQVTKYFSNGAQFKRAYSLDFELYDLVKNDEVQVHISII